MKGIYSALYKSKTQIVFKCNSKHVFQYLRSALISLIFCEYKKFYPNLNNFKRVSIQESFDRKTFKRINHFCHFSPKNLDIKTIFKAFNQINCELNTIFESNWYEFCTHLVFNFELN